MVCYVHFGFIKAKLWGQSNFVIFESAEDWKIVLLGIWESLYQIYCDLFPILYSLTCTTKLPKAQKKYTLNITLVIHHLLFCQKEIITYASLWICSIFLEVSNIFGYYDSFNIYPWLSSLLKSFNNANSTVNEIFKVIFFSLSWLAPR